MEKYSKQFKSKSCVIYIVTNEKYTMIHSIYDQHAIQNGQMK